MTNPRRHLLIAGAAWVLLSVVGMALLAGVQILPTVASNEADVEDRAFVLLTVVAMPVLMLVVVGLVYSAIRFRARADDEEDGPPIHGHRGFQALWVGVSSVMVVGLFGYGAAGLLEIRGAQNADYEINVTAEQWRWHFEYPGYELDLRELHVPLGERVRLNVTSLDAIHSFWVPAFGVKQDAVPGHVTTIYVTVTAAGDYGGMCAELCGLGHTGMTFPVVAQPMADLTEWLNTQPPPEPPPSGEPPPGESPGESPH